MIFYSLSLLWKAFHKKDSSVCVELAERAGIPFEVMHNHTTADAPETVYFVRGELRRLELKGIKCVANYPVYKGARTSMWQLIPQKLMPPTRIVRYCCSVLRERGGTGRFITTGVRWEESPNRRENRGIYEAGRKVVLNNDNDDRRRLFENCRLQAKRVCNPIIEWTDADVWDYIESEHLQQPQAPCQGLPRKIHGRMVQHVCQRRCHSGGAYQHHPDGMREIGRAHV